MFLFNLIVLYRMCEVGEITRECGAATPGLAKIYVVDIDDIVSIPSPNSNWTIVSNIVLKAGKFWKEIAFVEQKAGFEDEIADAVGGGFSKNIPLKFAKYAPQSNKWINNAIGARFVACVADNNGQMILVGDKVAAMRLQKAKGQTGQKTGDENGWDLTLTAEGVKPCYFYTGTVLLEESTEDSFDTTLTFSSSVNSDAAGVGGSVTATDADIKFEFNAITPQTGTPANMNLNVSSTLQMVVVYPTDYNGMSFQFTDLAGTTHTGVFTNGDVNF